MADRNGVMAALRKLLEEIEAVRGQLLQKASAASDRGDIEAVRGLLDRLAKVIEFQKRVTGLQQEWEKIFVREGKTGPPQGGLRTPEESFRRPILEALEELGGEAPVGEILDRVYEKVKHQLTSYDRQPLEKSGEPRWRNNARWCRKRLVMEGLLARDSPRGIWRLTPKGRAELSRLRKGG